jgi:hypothetical protein
MSFTKRYLEERSEQLGHGGELNEKVLEEIQESDADRADFLRDSARDEEMLADEEND